jgi:hypothetical protein
MPLSIGNGLMADIRESAHQAGGMSEKYDPIIEIARSIDRQWSVRHIKRRAEALGRPLEAHPAMVWHTLTGPRKI